MLNLTEAQLAQLPKFRDKWIEIGLGTGAVDKEKAEEAIDRVYKEGGLPPPAEKLWTASPKAAALLAAQMVHKTEEPTTAQIREMIGNFCHGSQDASWLSFYDTFLEFGVEGCQRLVPLMDLARDCGWWLPYDTVAIMSELPEYIRMDDDNRTHCEEGPAIRYSDGFAVWSWHGMRVRRELIEEPITIEMIDSESNAELKRMMMEKFGLGTYLEETGAEIIDTDECGELIFKPAAGEEEEPIVVVKVVNSTAEPDGTFRNYYLRVPPEIKTAREAVAWTFELTPAQYAPAIQT